MYSVGCYDPPAIHHCSRGDQTVSKSGAFFEFATSSGEHLASLKGNRRVHWSDPAAKGNSEIGELRAQSIRLSKLTIQPELRYPVLDFR
jgi:hypothetical protein